ncbi:calcium/sodium antiporter [Desulfurispirillum indicum]|uniref:calcium/sodium antiporter n=1 Tax=Desulfurispirillum indicum TaxID=936456 RepID=UPI001CFB1966|nr:calcium/sodium antiporter [Desulfurispirillum indicum]UCZ55696.1 calcium/sodium antiporter [Desulfurispirillum indicum]
MTLLLPALLFSLGIVILYFGAEFLVRGSVALALTRGIRPLVIGLTIVALGTSLPEFLVSFTGLLQGSSDIAIGNIVGSNIANIALVLALCALISPVRMDGSITRIELPIVLVTSVVFFLMCLDGTITRLDGIIMLCALIAFLVYCLRSGRTVSDDVETEHILRGSGSWKHVGLIVAGGIGLLLGARFMVIYGIEIARFLGVSELVIGITIIAVGTSLPELVTSIIASMKQRADISIGNILGSNIFNILFVCGFIALFAPISVEHTLIQFDIPFMLLITAVLYPIARKKQALGRIEGLLFLVAYVWYMYYIFTR